MENASKALIIAGEILIGVMILTIAVYIVSSTSLVPATYENTMSEQEINRFNAYFTKFDGRKDIAAQEIASAVYFAQEFNNEYRS